MIREEEIIKKSVEVLKTVLKPSRIILFGSRAKKSNGIHSDFDFAVDSPHPTISIERKIKEAIEKFIGLYKVDIIYLTCVDEEFKKIVLKTGRVIYEK